MKPNIRKTLFAAALLAALPASAHDVWVTSPTDIGANEKLHADLSYSHAFPHGESIPESRVKIFKPLEIVAPNGKAEPMKLESDNYHYVSATSLPKGTYRIAATYQPTFWSVDAAGKWTQDGTLKTVANAKSCEQTQMFGKSVVTVGGAFDAKTATTPVGQALEIVPLANPNTLKAGELLPLQVLYQGKPLAKATIVATADTVVTKDPESQNDHRDINGYSATSDKSGRANFLPLVEGLWKVKVIHKTPFADSTVCQDSALYATLIVPVGTERAAAGAGHHHHHHH